MIFFVYPIWTDLKMIKGINVSLRGVTTVAGGLITTAALVMMQKKRIYLGQYLLTSVTMRLILTKKLPGPLIVLACLLLGYLTL